MDPPLCELGSSASERRLWAGTGVQSYNAQIPPMWGQLCPSKASKGHGCLAACPMPNASCYDSDVPQGKGPTPPYPRRPLLVLKGGHVPGA